MREDKGRREITPRAIVCIVINRLQMDRTLDTLDERLNQLVTEVARLTGENYVTAMCQALEERLARLVSRGSDARPGPVLRLSLEIPEEMLASGVSLRQQVRKAGTNGDSTFIGEFHHGPEHQGQGD
jgi:hypothetical protein